VTELAAVHGLPYFVAWGRIVLGSAMAGVGKVSEGINEMRASLANQAELGLRIERPYCLTLLADALVRNGELDEADRVLAEALDLAAQTEARSFEAESHRVRGELYCRASPTCGAQGLAEFVSGWEIARAARCRALELRAAMSYCVHASDDRELETGRRMLAITLGEFEGEATLPAVIAARGLMMGRVLSA
jgi:predicted ATPase